MRPSIAWAVAAAALGLWAASGCGQQRPRTSQPTLAPDAAGALAAKPKQAPDAGANAPDPQVCPSGVAGASTRVKDIIDGVELVITARSPHAAEEIRKRATQLASLRPAGAGGAASGCAIRYVPGAETTIEEVRGGVSVTITATSPDAVTGLRKAARRHL
jgi:hypothetical protein